MKKVCVVANPMEMNRSAVSCRTVTLRERLLNRLFGSLHRVTVIVPGENVRMEIVTEKGEGKDEAV